MASCTPAAPRLWPDRDLVELIGGLSGPNTSRMARSSTMSPMGVEVPWRRGRVPAALEKA